MQPIYFNELQQRVRDIRTSERSAMAKIADIIALSIDYDSNSITMTVTLKRIKEILRTQLNVERFANFLMFTAEARANGNEASGNKEKAYSAWVMSDVEWLARQFVVDLLYGYDPNEDYIFRYPSYNGVRFARDGEKHDSSVCLPQELQAYKKNYVVLRVRSMNRLIEHCSYPFPGYPRPYDILAQLDHLVIECLPEGVFPVNHRINARSGVFLQEFKFMFSHFEVDLQEPDPNYRTLYVVYNYY